MHFAGAPDFSPTRIAVPGPTGFPLAKFQPGAVAGPGYSPFIRIAGSNVVYNAPIVAIGNGPFDVVHHTNTADRVLGVHIAGKSKPGQFAESWADLLFVKGFDAGQPIVYLSTDAGQPLTAVLERSTYVPALNNASFNGGDDFLGSARERLFGFINGQTGASNPQAQGFQHLVLDGHASQDASAGNTALISALRNGGDLLNVFGDFPTLADPRHADAYSPLWDAQLGLWTAKAVKAGLNTRQIDENQVLNLAATRPDLLTGVNPATGQPAPYGSVGVDINCAVIGYTAQAPTANLAPPAPGSSSRRDRRGPRPWTRESCSCRAIRGSMAQEAARSTRKDRAMTTETIARQAETSRPVLVARDVKHLQGQDSSLAFRNQVASGLRVRRAAGFKSPVYLRKRRGDYHPQMQYGRVFPKSYRSSLLRASA